MRRRRAWLQNRPGMESARFIAFHVMKAGGYKIRRVEQICRFPWDIVVRRVQLEDWDSPAMKQFDEEADAALAVINPKAYAEYMAGKAARESGGAVGVTPLGPLKGGHVENTEDPDFRISDELNW